jgi:hypothetical protein
MRSVGAALLHADRRTDGQTTDKKVIGAFRDYAKAPEIHGTIQYSRIHLNGLVDN